MKKNNKILPDFKTELKQIKKNKYERKIEENNSTAGKSPIDNSRPFGIAIIVVGFFLVAFISFAAGAKIGFKKAKFSYRWGENYEKNFIGPPSKPMGEKRFMFFKGPGPRDFRNAHGLAGEVISISGSNLIIKDRDGKENTVNVTNETIIKKFRENLKLEDVKAGDEVVVVGSPDPSGVIKADLIRIFGLKNLN